MFKRNSVSFLTAAALALWFPAPAGAITVTPTSSGSDLLSALVSDASSYDGGLAGIGVSVTAQDGSIIDPLSAALSTGTFTNASGVYGIGDGVVLSTGDVAFYGDGPNTTSPCTSAVFVFFGCDGIGYGVPASAAEDALLAAGGGTPFNDVSQIELVFMPAVGFDLLTFDLLFGTEELDTDGPDVFAVHLNGAPIFVIDSGDAGLMVPPAIPATTELDKVSSLFSVSAPVLPGSNTLTFTLGNGPFFGFPDSSADSTVYISGLGLEKAPAAVPEPSTGLLGLSGMALALWLRRRRGG